MFDDADHLVALRVERHAGLLVARIAEVIQHLKRLAQNASHTLDDGVGLLARVRDRALQVVHDGQPSRGHLGACRRALSIQFAGVTLAQVVQVGHRPSCPILGLGQFGVRIGLGDNRFG